MSDTPTTSVPRVPAELTDLALDFLHDDEESLANCSLVCKDWFPTARYHVFRELLLHPWNLETFMNLVTHPLATIMPYIVSLIIDQVKIRHVDLFEAMFLRFPPFHFVRRLELRNIRWCNYEPPSVHTLVSAFKNVTDLTLYHLVFNTPTDLWSVITRFPSLQRLSVTQPAFFNGLPHFSPGFDAADVFPHLRAPNIHTLEISDAHFYQTHILHWFSCHRTLVNSLSVSLQNPDLPYLGQYLQVLGPSLHSLQVDASNPAVFFTLLNLSFHTHLQKIRLYNFTPHHALSSMIPAVFAAVTSSYIYEIEFAFCLEEDDNDTTSTTPGSSMWSALDTVLSRLTTLRTVRFTLSPDQPGSQSLVIYLKRGLTSCDARGILSFEHANNEGAISQPDSCSGMVSGPFCIAQI